MKKTSVPEQTIFFYIKKFVDPDAKNNEIRIGHYVADVTFNFNSQKYNVEYDSYSQHKDCVDKDTERNYIFKEHGYKVIRMRDKGLDEIPNCINITFDFESYTKKSLCKASLGIMELLRLFDINEEIDVSADLTEIREMYNRA